MDCNILGLNFSHNSSACVLLNGKTVFFLEEDRLSRIKNDMFPLKLITYISENFTIDKIVISGLLDFGIHRDDCHHLLNKYFKNKPVIDLYDCHHMCHSFLALKNSGFSKCLSIVIDGSGSQFFSKENGVFYETESIFSYPENNLNPKVVYRSYRTNNGKTDLLTLSKVYEVLTRELGFGFLEAGKTMGLSSYGKPSPQIPNLYLGQKGNPDVFDVDQGGTGGKLKKKYNFLLNGQQNKSDLSYKVQTESQENVGNLIDEVVKKTNIKNICCSGGYFLNCVSNYYLTKRFPDINFYFEPISSDAGNAIGAAKIAWFLETQDETINSQKTLYYGSKYTKKQLLKGIKKYVDD